MTRDTEGKGRSIANALLRQVSDAIPVFLRQYQLGQVLRVAKPRDALLASQSLWRDSPDAFSCKLSGRLRQAAGEVQHMNIGIKGPNRAASQRRLPASQRDPRVSDYDDQ